MRCADPQAAFTRWISSNTSPNRPARKAPRSITMSTSSAPASTAERTSPSFTSMVARPDGNAVATLATFTPDPATTARATGTMSG